MPCTLEKVAAKFDAWQIGAEFVKITYCVWLSAVATAAFQGSPDWGIVKRENHIRDCGTRKAFFPFLTTSEFSISTSLWCKTTSSEAYELQKMGKLWARYYPRILVIHLLNSNLGICTITHTLPVSCSFYCGSLKCTFSPWNTKIYLFPPYYINDLCSVIFRYI